MKRLKYFIIGLASLAVVITACEEFLTREPIGVLDQNVLASAKGVDALLIAAYANLDGYVGWSFGMAPWQSAATNWVFGDVYADDAYKGTEPGDQPQINPIERYEHDATNDYMNGKWRAVYDGISRCNDVIVVANKADDIPDADKNRIIAEARFLRAHYHFDIKKVFGNVVFMDEVAVENGDFYKPNDSDIWPNIEADFQFAIDNLPATQAEVGRATSWAAKAYLAKVHMHQGDNAAAKPLLLDVVNNGPFALNAEYHTNFRTDGNNSSEAIFSLQTSINDGSGEGANGNYGEILNSPHGGTAPGGCCGFYQPSQNLVNAFQTDANGLPLLDTFNDSDVTNDDGLNSSDPFTEHTGNLDPRLDWTVGRRGIPYLDHGDHPGADWIRQQSYGGPYSPIKRMFYKAEENSNENAGGWGGVTTAINYEFIRLPDVMLMLAECHVEDNELPQALALVNQIRARAANPDGFVKESDGVTPAANYVINEYPAFADQAFARKAVRFERRLELGMEGHRFFDLARYGTAESTINTYLAKAAQSRTYLQGASFSAHNVLQPIPQQAIDDSSVDGVPTLIQNPGY